MAEEADKPRVPADDNSDEISAEATPTLADAVRGSNALMLRMLRFMHFQEIGMTKVFWQRYVPQQYMDSVADALGRHSMEYRQFVNLISLYQYNRKGVLATMVSLKELMREQQGLLASFNDYLPEGYHIFVPQHEGPSEAVIEFFNAVQEKLQDDDETYLTLRNNLIEYRKGNKDISSVKQEIGSLFRDKPNLTSICFNFIDALASNFDQPQMSSDLNNDESDMTCQKRKEDSERDIPDQYINSVKRELGPNSQECRDFLELISTYKAERIGIPELLSRLKVLLKDHYKLVMDLLNYLPKEYQTDLADAADFVDKVKREFIHDKERVASFQNIMTALEENKNIVAAAQEVKNLFHDRADIIEEFFSFFQIPKSE